MAAGVSAAKDHCPELLFPSCGGLLFGWARPGPMGSFEGKVGPMTGGLFGAVGPEVGRIGVTDALTGGVAVRGPECAFRWLRLEVAGACGEPSELKVVLD